MTGLAQDVRSAVRSLLRAPAFTIASLVTLALGIGAVTAIFAVVNATMLRPLPYPEPQRIAALVVAPNDTFHAGRDYVYLRDRVSAFETVAAVGFGTGWNLSTGDTTEFVGSMPVSSGFFDAHGVTPLLGRSFSAAEDQPDGPDAAVISEDLWRRTFDSRPDVVGQIVLLGGTPHTIVGVMPDMFHSIPDVDLWTPLRATAGDRGTNDQILARLAPGATLAQANAELDTLRAGLLDLPRYSEQRAAGLRWVPYRQLIGAGTRTPLLLLLGAVGCLLLIACLNVASLQTARALELRDDFSTRAALGASRGALVRRALAESLVLSVGGAAAGFGLATLGVPLLSRLTPFGLFGALTGGQPTDPDWRVVVMVLGSAAVAGLVFGAFPAAIAVGARVRTTTSGGARTTTSRAGVWLRRAFTAGQVALAVILLVGAGLLARTIANMTSVDPGFEPTGVVVAKMSLQGATATDPARLGDLVERGVARLEAIPGVASVAATNSVPVEAGINLTLQPPAGALVDENRSVDWRFVTPGYFDLFRIPLVAGRDFGARDTAGNQPVAIVNEAFARAYFGTASAVGRTVQLAPGLDDPAREIVGIVADVKARSNAGWARGLTALSTPPSPALYVPAAQTSAPAAQAANRFFPMNWVLRTDGAVAALEREAATAMAGVDPTLPFIGFEPMSDIIANDVSFQRFLATLTAVFSLTAIILAAVGLYGLIAYTVVRRTRETGIRLALGATAGRVTRAFMAEGILLTSVGVGLGLLAAAFLMRVVDFLLFGVTPLDPLIFTGVAALLAAIAAVATFLPASRAARTDPVEALRSE